MKKLILLLAALMVSCGKKADEKPVNAADPLVSKGKDIFESTGNCAACHKADNDILAPSLPTIAKAYRHADMTAFLKGQAGPVVDPARYDIMKTNFSVTETMSDDDLKAIAAYVGTYAK